MVKQGRWFWGELFLLWACNWEKTAIRETIKTTQKQYKSKKWEVMGELEEAWSSTLLSNSLLVDPQVPFCLSVQNIDKMTRSKHWRGLLLNIAQKLSKFEKGCHNILILPLIFAQISLNMPPKMPQSTIVKLKKRHGIFLAVQDSSIGDSVTQWVSQCQRQRQRHWERFSD